MQNEDHEVTCSAMPAPSAIAHLIRGYDWYRNMQGMSGGHVYRLTDPRGGTSFYLKHGRGSIADDLAAEVERLVWLKPRIAVPTVLGFHRDDEQAWLLLSAIPGRTAYQALKAAPGRCEAIVQAVALFLKRLHDLPIADCPFDSGQGRRLEQARSRMDAGLVDITEFDDERHGWHARRVWMEMTGLLPLRSDDVVTHGDFTLENLLVDNHGAVAGCIDAGRAGVADRYQDLAILGRSLDEFGVGAQRRLFTSYGIAEPDETKQRFYLMLDEFF
ncbi:APH(3') family aminoglycoside O-phosphotransferase [Bordetella sp. LUAb4]|uniref:APH(3') family aminoglycoside O-phosphotransferase n=1 Tax=Bordetella sp. LUAb4 TaxID=2843195 RepID=UPI001E54EC78|nr:APH(3') family aminoglycoside O-phosphotransferase [Bordetella sp. LUAb4]